MYTSDHEHMVEDKCFQVRHIQKVLNVIKSNFQGFFDKFLESQQSHISPDRIDELHDKFIVDYNGKHLVFDRSRACKELFQEAISDFEKDRGTYIDLFDQELLEEYEDDPQQFKSRALKIDTPIIRKTLQNIYAEQLDKYRAAFNRANAMDLLTMVSKLSKFSEDYVKNKYNQEIFESIVYYKDFDLTILDTEEYTVHGVVGGGIKSTMLYKNYPEVFSSRSRLAVWALWYLVGKEKFGCEMDSEFLMIDLKKNSTQQNYFYPYELFEFYALQIYVLIKEAAKLLGVELNSKYRFVYVDAFLSFIALERIQEINFLSKSSEDKSYE